MSKIYDKFIAIQHSRCFDIPFIKDFQMYSDHLNAAFLEQSKKDKNHYSRIMLMNILNKSTHEKRFLIDTINNTEINNLKNEEQIIPNSFNRQNLSSTISIFKKKEDMFSNLIDIITFSLIPSIFLMFLEENSFENFVDFIINLAYNNEEVDFQILLSRSIFVSPIFLRFMHDVLYPVFKPPYGKLVSLNNIFLDDKYLQIMQIKIIKSFKTNIHACPSYIVKFLRALKASSQLTSVQILKKCIFDPIISNPSLFLVNDVWCFDSKNENDQISSILSLALTDKLIEQIYEIMENNNSYFNPFLDKKQFENNSQYINFHRIIDKIDILAIGQIQSILEGKSPSGNIFDIICDESFREYLLFPCHIDGDVSPWEIICQILKYLPDLPPSSIKSNDNNDDDNNNNKDFNFSDFLEIIQNSLIEISSESRKIQVNILLNRVKYIFRKDQSIFTHEEFEKQLDLMAKKQEKIEITADEIKKLEEKISLISVLKQFPVSEVCELYYTYLTTEIKPEEFQFPCKIHEIVENSLFLTSQFDKYLNYCIEKVGENCKHDCSDIFYHRYWNKLRFHDYLAIRSDLHKYDFLFNDYLSKNYAQVIYQKKKFLKIINFALQNNSLYEKEMKQVREIFCNNEDPLAKYVHFSHTLNSYFQKILFAVNKKDLEAEEKFSLIEIFICLANPPNFVSNIVYLNEYTNYVNYPNSFIEKHANIQKYIEYFFDDFINKNINQLLTYYKIPIFHLSLNHIRKLTIYITGDDTKLISIAYRSILNLFMPGCLLKKAENLDEFTACLERNEIPEKYTLKPGFEEFKAGATYRVTLKVSKSFSKKDFSNNDNVNNPLISRYAIFASSCSGDYKSERPEEKFFRLGKNDLQVITYTKGADKENLKNINGVYCIQSNYLLNFMENATKLFM